MSPSKYHHDNPNHNPNPNPNHNVPYPIPNPKLNPNSSYFYSGTFCTGTFCPVTVLAIWPVVTGSRADQRTSEEMKSVTADRQRPPSINPDSDVIVNWSCPQHDGWYCGQLQYVLFLLFCDSWSLRRSCLKAFEQIRPKAVLFYAIEPSAEIRIAGV